MKMSKKIIYVTLIVMMSFFTIFAQNNVMAAKKENKVYTISKKSKLIDVGSHLYSTYGSDYVNKYTEIGICSAHILKNLRCQEEEN